MYFKNLALFTPQDFLRYVWPFSKIMHERIILRHFVMALLFNLNKFSARGCTLVFSFHNFEQVSGCWEKRIQMCALSLILLNIRHFSLYGYRSSPPEVFLGKGILKICSKFTGENMQQIYRRTPMLKCDFNIVALQLYWNHTSAWVSSCKLAAYFQNTFS